MRHYSVGGIDPGTNLCGLSIVTIDLDKYELLYVRAETIECNKVFLWDDYRKTFDSDSRRKTRLSGLKREIRRFYAKELVDVFCAESSYGQAKTISALGPLVEAMTIIRDVVSSEHPITTFKKMSPSEVRSIIGAGKKGKDTVLRAVLGLLGDSLIDLRSLDDNAIDAIAIAIAYILKKFKP